MPLQDVARSMPTRQQELEKLKADGMECLKKLIEENCSHEDWAAVRAIVHKLQDIEKALVLETSKHV